MQKITVHSSKTYDILIGKGLLEQAAEKIAEVTASRRTVVITDDTVDSLYGEKMLGQLRSGGFWVDKLVLPHGEKTKNIANAVKIYEKLIACGITRGDFIVALGGGVIGDLVGFAAATYLRGIDFVQIPTTFLSQIDSSVGGKTAVNIEAGKNLVGAFWQPVLVLCDTGTLSTLTEEYFTDGTAEAIKYAAILDEEMFVLMEREGVRENLDGIIHRCIDLKREIVEEDEFDRGRRALLNFGHTFGHSIEKYYHFEKYTHGHAVGIGMVIITEAAERLGLTEKGCADRIRALLCKNNLPTGETIPNGELAHLAMTDKKRDKEDISLVLIKRIGEGYVHKIKSSEMGAFLDGRLG